MTNHRSVLFASASLLAVAGVAAPAMAQQAAGSQPNEIQEVVVTGIRASLRNAIDAKRKSDEIVDAISSEDIGKLPDRNVADAVQRIPGVNTFSQASGEGGFDENDRIAIRGTPPSLTQVTVNGHYVSSGDWFILDQYQTVGRSISATLIPSEIVGQVNVYKTQSADMLEGGTAGSVDILTRDPLSQKKGFSAQAEIGGVYTTLAGATTPQFNGLLGWKSEDGTLGVIVQGFDEQRQIRRDGQEVLGYNNVTSSMPIGVAYPNLVGAQYPSAIGSALFEQKRERTGGDIDIHWRPNDQFDLRLDGFYSNLDATNHNSNYLFYGAMLFPGAAPIPGSVVVKNNTIVSAAFPTTPGVAGLVYDNFYRVGARAQTDYVDLTGKYRANDRLTFSGAFGYSEGIGETPSQPTAEFEAITGGSYTLGYGGPMSFTNTNPATDTSLVNDWGQNPHLRSRDNEFYAKFDADYRVDAGVFKDVKVGVRYSDHDHTSDGWGSCCGPGGTLANYNPQPYPSNFGSAFGMAGFINNPLAPNWGTLEALVDKSNPVSKDNWYFAWSSRVHETDVAGYAMANIGGEGWRGNFGVRVVQAKLDPYVNVSDPNGTHAGDISTVYGDYYVDDAQHTYFEVLPSANLSFDLRTDLKLRVAASETVSMPDYSALGGTVNVQDTTFTGNGGNPNLKPVKAANYDASLEWYYRPMALTAVSLFYKDLSNYIDYGSSNEVYYSQFYKQYETYSVTSPINASGQLQGVELQLQQPLAYGFGFLFNYSFTDSENYGPSGGPLIGTARHVGNLTGWYENKWLSARLAYTYRSHVLVGIDRSDAEVQEGTGTLDAAVNVKLTSFASVSFDAMNLTDELLKYYASNPTQPRAVYDNGRQFYLTLRLKY